MTSIGSGTAKHVGATTINTGNAQAVKLGPCEVGVGILGMWLEEPSCVDDLLCGDKDREGQQKATKGNYPLVNIQKAIENGHV